MYYKTPNGVSEKRGFPNPATDASLQNLDFNHLLIHNPAATFLMRITGNLWVERGIFDGDIVIIDRVMRPRPTDLLAYILHDEFLISDYTSMPVDALAWGVVTSVIHQYRHKKMKEES